MYNQYVLSLLKEMNFKECQHVAIEAERLVSVGERGRQVIVYRSQTAYYFKAIGSPYLLAMAKWLTQSLEQKRMSALAQLTITELVVQFSLPAHKRQDALLILQLIEKLHDSQA
ncbi:hypothetical protein [Caedibacter taeniospiralis]|jgi:hypothetical protein|uniref:hypothetical protein n=1 Tax=Caedibacter taeniospiralis TaxID=28907 RepID=UPI0037BF07D4